MAKTTKTAPRSGRYTIGRQGFSKISAVEGIRLDFHMNELFGEFDRKELSPQKRRDVLSGKYGAKR